MRAFNWLAFQRRVERNRRVLTRGSGSWPVPADYYARATFVSFRLDGHHELAEADVWSALGMTAAGGGGGTERPAVKLRSRLSQRLRNHAAILHQIENALKNGVELNADAAVRWYTTISSGLSMNALGAPSTLRLDDVVRRINFPHLRLRAALRGVATTYLQVLGEPLVPSFNGILARLLMRYHLGRSGLPAVLLDPILDARLTRVDAVIGRLVQLLDRRYEDLLDSPRS